VRRLAILAFALVLAACGGEEESTPPTTTISGEEATTEEATPTATEAEETESEPAGPVVVLETAEGGDVVVQVEIADTAEEREVGLMNRESLPEDAGMIFLFDEDVSSGFWMKDTLIPLSIAFADANGTIVRILDMEPCETEECPTYEPGAFYRSALEVNQGAFEQWGVAEGDKLTLQQ
jgi:uncharacterized protein